MGLGFISATIKRLKIIKSDRGFQGGAAWVAASSFILRPCSGKTFTKFIKK